jgi:hypothetical protein
MSKILKENSRFTNHEIDFFSPKNSYNFVKLDHSFNKNEIGRSKKESFNRFQPVINFSKLAFKGIEIIVRIRWYIKCKNVRFEEWVI